MGVVAYSESDCWFFSCNELLLAFDEIATNATSATTITTRMKDDDDNGEDPVVSLLSDLLLRLGGTIILLTHRIDHRIVVDCLSYCTVP
jgi:hypothetical protein